MPEETPEYKPEPDRFWFIALCQDDGYYWPDCRAVGKFCLIGAESLDHLIRSVEDSYQHDPMDAKSAPSVKSWLETEDLFVDPEAWNKDPDEVAHHIEQYSRENGNGGISISFIGCRTVPPYVTDTARHIDNLCSTLEDDGVAIVPDWLNAMELGEAITLWHRGHKQHPIHIV